MTRTLERPSEATEARTSFFHGLYTLFERKQKAPPEIVRLFPSPFFPTRGADFLWTGARVEIVQRKTDRCNSWYLSLVINKTKIDVFIDSEHNKLGRQRIGWHSTLKSLQWHTSSVSPELWHHFFLAPSSSRKLAPIDRQSVIIFTFFHCISMSWNKIERETMEWKVVAKTT